jgi:hypothetical protein
LANDIQWAEKFIDPSSLLSKEERTFANTRKRLIGLTKDTERVDRKFLANLSKPILIKLCEEWKIEFTGSRDEIATRLIAQVCVFSISLNQLFIIHNLLSNTMIQRLYP